MILSDRNYEILYMEYTLSKDKYGKQQVLYNTDAGISFISSCLYSDRGLLPMVPGLFVDLDKKKHMIDSDANLALLTQEITEKISTYIQDLSPDVTITYDRLKQMFSISIVIQSGTKITLAAAENSNTVQLKVNNKKFNE